MSLDVVGCGAWEATLDHCSSGKQNNVGEVVAVPNGIVQVVHKLLVGQHAAVQLR